MKVRTPIAMALATALILLPFPAPAHAAPADAAFSTGTGVLDVDRAGYLAKHDIVYHRPNTDPVRGLTVGNGRTGAMAWDQNGLMMQVSGVDLAQQSTYAAGNVNLTGVGTSLQSRLSLHDGTLTTGYDGGRTVTVMGRAGDEVMGLRVEGFGSAAVGLDLSLWDLSQVQNIADVPDLDTWRTATTFADGTAAGISRGQSDPNGFGYTLAATVEGTGFTTQTINGSRVRLTIAPAAGYTIWFTAASRRNAPGGDSVQAARDQLTAVRAAGYAGTLTAYRNWWHAFWARSFVQYDTGGSDRDYLYARNLGALKAFTRTRYATDSLWVPETMGWDGNARGTVNSDFVNDIYSTGTEAAYNMYLYYRYTNDTTYLRDVAYPFLRESARFYQNRLSRNGSQYYMASSNAHETYWDVRNALTDLAAVRLLFPLAVQVSIQLGLDAGLRAGWSDVLTNLAPYQVSNGAYLPHDPPAAPVRNGENVALELVWPYDQSGIGHPDTQTSIQTFTVRPHPYGNVWANDHVHAARLGLGAQALSGMRTMLQKYQNHPNGMTTNTNGVFEYLGIHLVAMNESLMQSYDDKIRVFPAVPADSTFTGRFTLLAMDGFLVSSEREAQETKYVGLRSLHGKQARVVNPWGNQEIRVRRTSDNAVLATTTATEVGLATVANTTYVVERTAKPLTAYTSTVVTGTANNGVKTLSGTASALGLGTASGQGGVGLLSAANGLCVTAGNGQLIANGTSIGAAQRFDLVDLGGGTVALRARVNNQFVAAENAGAEPLVANRPAAGPWETFARVNNPDGTISLRATVNNKYVCADGAGAQPLIANRDAVGPWERFSLVDG